MPFKWFNIDGYRVSVGSQTNSTDYASVQLMGTQFYAMVRFSKSGPLPAAIAPVEGSQQRFFGSLDFQQMPAVVDMLRNESPVRFGYIDGAPEKFKFLTGSDEPVGEGE